MSNFVAVAIVLYAAALLLYLLRGRVLTTVNAASWVAPILASAVALHALSLYLPLIQKQAMHIDFYSALSHVMLWIAAVMCVEMLRKQMIDLVLFIVPLAFISLLACTLCETNQNSMYTVRGGIAVHVLASLIAYGLLLYAGLHALLISIQDYYLRHPGGASFLKRMPPLQDMENTLFHVVTAGWLVLSVALVVGWWHVDAFFGQHIAHKSILSLFAWLMFLVLLIGRWRLGWRGKQANRMVFIAVSLLLLAFLGTKFIREFIIS